MVRPKKQDHSDNEPTPDTEWFVQRAAEFGFSLMELSRRTMAGERNQDALGRFLSGKGRNKLRPSEIARISVALGAPIAEVFAALGFDLPETASCTAIGQIAGDSTFLPFPEGRRPQVPAPFDHSHRYQAVEVNAPSLSAWHDAILYFIPAAAVQVRSIGRLAMVELAGSTPKSPKAVVGWLEPSAEGGIKLLDGKQEILAADIISAAPIKWVRMP
ncbi:hypothetical protein [Hyphomicrobium sulfonivorans]|uniref:hypothetical protein n=1 Tax=Hyphomicrobium sulfonivorans TaxID=121290 RepID=UPI0008390A72|nr:hypothetical protein [Hyphomicrobium sulfonivorans]